MYSSHRRRNCAARAAGSRPPNRSRHLFPRPPPGGPRPRPARALLTSRPDYHPRLPTRPGRPPPAPDPARGAEPISIPAGRPIPHCDGYNNARQPAHHHPVPQEAI